MSEDDNASGGTERGTPNVDPFEVSTTDGSQPYSNTDEPQRIDFGVALVFGTALAVAYLYSVWPIPDELLTVHGVLGGIVLTTGIVVALYAIDALRSLLADTEQ